MEQKVIDEELKDSDDDDEDEDEDDVWCDM